MLRVLGCFALALEVFHYKIPDGSMTSHEFNYLFCNLCYLSIKQPCYSQRKYKHKNADYDASNDVY